MDRYKNVFKSLKGKSSPLWPLTRLLPFVVTLVIHLAWLRAPIGPSGAHLVYSNAFIWFMCFWGLQFGNQVGRMILAHVTKSEFPIIERMWIWSLIGAVDGNAKALFGVYVLCSQSILKPS